MVVILKFDMENINNEHNKDKRIYRFGECFEICDETKIKCLRNADVNNWDC